MVGKPLLMITSLIAVALAGCTSTGDEPASESHGHEDSLGDDVLAQLRALYVDQPMLGGQQTPSHTFLKEDADNYSFLHWNNADPMMATGLIFVGDAFRAQGCVGVGGVSQAQIDAGYTHFHKQTSANWDAGHHAVANDDSVVGFWFRHIAAAPGVDPMGVGASDVGEFYPLMPSYENAPACSTSPLFA